MISEELRQRRLAVIKEHMDTEVTHEFDRTLHTFNGHPHYEIMATGQVFDGDDDVMGYYPDDQDGVSDQRHDKSRFHVADDAVIVEFELLGTNLGEFYGLPPTGKGVPGSDHGGVLLRGRPHRQRTHLLRLGEPGHPDRAR